MDDPIRLRFGSENEYAAALDNPRRWQPLVAAVCERHGLPAVSTREVDLVGTNLVALIDRRYVVKLYPDLFDGSDSYTRERAAYTLLRHDPGLPVARLIAAGTLFDGGAWRWPYLITSAIGGRS